MYLNQACELIEDDHSLVFVNSNTGALMFFDEDVGIIIEHQENTREKEYFNDLKSSGWQKY